MPTHLHAIVFDREFDTERLSAALNDFRRYTGRQLSDYVDSVMPRAFGEMLRTEAGEDRTRQFWQPTRHPVAIQTEAFYRQKLDYIHANPCRKGLVLYPEEWRFSSARYYADVEAGVCEVPITQLEW